MTAAAHILVLALLQPAPAPPLDPAGASVAEADLVLDVRVQAETIRWRQAGDLELRAWAEPAGLDVEESISTGLPDVIPVGRTFRNIEWRLRVAAGIGQPPALGEADAEAETSDISEGD